MGLIIATQLEAAHPATGESFELNAIAAVVLGGTSLMGGRGSILGSLIGAFVIGVLSDGLVMLGVSEFWQMVIKGTVIVLAVAVDQLQSRLQARLLPLLESGRMMRDLFAALQSERLHSAVTTAACRRADMSRPLIVILIPSQDNPFFKSEADAAAARAQALGYRARVDAHDDDAYRQDNLIDAAIASNASAIILDNAGADSSIAAVRRATQAGIPCFLIDREIEADGVAKAQIIADNDQGARIVAEEFARALGPRREICGTAGSRIRHQRAGANAGLPRHPGCTTEPERVAAQSANWSQSEAFQKTETMLQAHADIRGILAGNDTMALGAVAAVKSAGLKGIVITGFDGSPDAIAAIRAGTLRATALQPAVLIARLAVDEAHRFLQTGITGKPERQVIACDLVTQQNADDYGEFEKVR